MDLDNIRWYWRWCQREAVALERLMREKALAAGAGC
jgi:hypothetical protein